MNASSNTIFVASLLLFCIFATDSFAQKRIALVIGNSAYQQQSLRNPVNDAEDVSKTLRNLGFSVDLKLNADQESMEKAVQEFGRKLQANTVGLFYFSGHGVQYGGSNYLIPIGAMVRVSAPDHLRYKTVDAGYVLGVMKQSGSGLNIVVLDACRNNPFKSFSRSMGKGLKRISGAEGTIIAYSTSPGKVALDGDGRNSPYTSQFIKQMLQPNLPVELMFKQVRKGVKMQTGGKQSPWYEASIDGDFYFIKGEAKFSSDDNYAINSNIIKRQSDIIFQDYFSNNSNGWLEHDIVGSEKFSIENGKYVLISRDQKSHNPQLQLSKLNESDDFKIEALMSKKSGADNHGYGITWGAKDYNNRYVFIVSGDGHYLYAEVTNGKWKHIAGWTKTTAVNEFNASNKLAITKKGTRIKFFVNDEKVYESDFLGFFGNRIGLMTNLKQKIEVDFITVAKIY